MLNQKILIVDCNPINRDILSRYLGRQGFAVDMACSGSEVLEKIRTDSFDLVFLDLEISGDVGGYQIFEQIRNEELLRRFPVIVISSAPEMHEVARCIELGAEDYLLKPLNPILLKARLNASLEKKRMQDQQLTYMEDLRHAKLQLETQNTQLKSQLREIEELQAALRAQAIRDPLTGLYNRRYMEDAINNESARALRKGQKFSIVLIDVDNLKEINDVHGHWTGGDQAIRALADVLKHMCREEDVVCRYGGDEFLVMLYETPAHTAFERAVQWKDAITEMQMTSPTGTFRVFISAGVAEFPTNGMTSEQVIIHADRMLYQAKERGRNQVVV